MTDYVLKDKPYQDPEAPKPSDSSETGEAVDEAKSEAPKHEGAPELEPSDNSNSTTTGESNGVAESAESAEAAPPVEAPAEAVEDAPSEPQLTDAHPEAQPIVDVAPELLDVLKGLGNKLAPVLKKLHDYEDKFVALEDEAKARFNHMRQKATEALASLESIFKRG